jgi:hypothetical protein
MPTKKKKPRAKKTARKVPRTPRAAKRAAPKKAARPARKPPAPKKSSTRKPKPSPRPPKKAASAPKRNPRAHPRRTVAGADHPKLTELLDTLRPGRHAGGTLIITKPGAHQDEMRRWLSGNDEGRVAIGRTAFGDIVLFRDLRAFAFAQGTPDAELACDVALIDLNLKKMVVLAWSVEELVQRLADRGFQDAFLRRALYDEVKAQRGDYADDEAYTFVPALRLGGSESAASVQRAKWRVYQDILFQL